MSTITEIIQEIQCSNAITYAKEKSWKEILCILCEILHEVFTFKMHITRDLLEVLIPLFLSKFPYCIFGYNIFVLIIATIFSYDVGIGIIFMTIATLYCVIGACYLVYNYSMYAPLSIRNSQATPSWQNLRKYYKEHFPFYKLWIKQSKFNYNDNNKSKIFESFYAYNPNNIKGQRRKHSCTHDLDFSDHLADVFCTNCALLCVLEYDINKITECFTEEHWEEHFGYIKLCNVLTAIEHPQILKQCFMNSETKFISLLVMLVQISKCSCRVAYKYKIYIRLLRILLVIKFLSRDNHIEWVKNSKEFYRYNIVEFMEYYNKNKIFFKYPYLKYCFKKDWGFECDPCTITIYAYFCSFYYQHYGYKEQFKYVSANKYETIVTFTGLNESYCYFHMDRR
eukprot:297519_1